MHRAAPYIATPGRAIVGGNLNAQRIGFIEQAFRTVIGATYKVTFALAGSSTGAPTVKTMTVSATGGQVQTYSFDVTGKTTTAMGWRRAL